MLRLVVGIAALIGAIVLGMLVFTVPGDDDGDAFASCRESRVAGGPGAIGGPFELVDGAGNTVTETDVITEPSLVYFGYTYCPDVCPMDVSRNVTAVEILEERGRRVQPVFISVDPARDTPQVVGEFAEVMHPRMVGLTGSEEQVAAAARAYKAYHKAHPAQDGEYLVDHSTFSYLVLPEHGFVEFFRRELSPDQMADSIGCFLSQS